MSVLCGSPATRAPPGGASLTGRRAGRARYQRAARRPYSAGRLAGSDVDRFVGSDVGREVGSDVGKDVGTLVGTEVGTLVGVDVAGVVEVGCGPPEAPLPRDEEADAWLAGAAGLAIGHLHHALALAAVVALVGAGQALALDYDDHSTISVAAVGALAGVALFGPKAALPLALASVTVAWSTNRAPVHQVLFNVGALSLASLAAAGVFATIHVRGNVNDFVLASLGVVGGAVYYAVNMGLLSFAVALEGHTSWRAEWREKFGWLTTHYLAYGFVGAVIAIAYHAAGLYALAAFAVPLFVLRQTQQAYVAHAQRSAEKLRSAAQTIQTQNVSLEEANKALKDRSTAAMESLSATVDARDTYTAGHSRRVQQVALAIGAELGFSQAELDLLGHAALFHDIGKLAVPDNILLKPSSLSREEWTVMQKHAGEGAQIIDRLGFLTDAVPAIRHHHERFDGRGYPDNLAGEEIPLGARIIHVADAFDSMLSTRVYRPARAPRDALRELREHAGKQFCPRCVSALEDLVGRGGVELGYHEPHLAAVAS